MIFETLGEEEIYQAYILYASLHGLSTDEHEVRARIERYLNNTPDAALDDAILAFSEDRMLAPPDVVLPQWGKSRVYQLRAASLGGWRHHVCESWFANGCRFTGDHREPPLAHFWTEFEVGQSAELPRLVAGTRMQFSLDRDRVEVRHRHGSPLGQLPPTLAEEMCLRQPLGIRYLPLVDQLVEGQVQAVCKLLVNRGRAQRSADGHHRPCCPSVYRRPHQMLGVVSKPGAPGRLRRERRLGRAKRLWEGRRFWRVNRFGRAKLPLSRVGAFATGMARPEPRPPGFETTPRAASVYRTHGQTPAATCAAAGV